MKDVFVTGGTGYIGSRLIERLVSRGHHVRALARPGSERRLPRGCEVISGNALDRTTFQHAVARGAVVVPLVGTPRPSPRKADQFRAIDRVSGFEAAAAAREAGASHIVYVGVARPAPVMGAYIEVREEVEAAITASGVPATILRPWYVLGPGHRWPIVLLPLYALLRRLPATRAGAERLAPVRLEEMLRALVQAIEAHPPAGSRVLAVPDIRRSALSPPPGPPAG